MELRTVPVASLDLVLGRLRLVPEALIARMVESIRAKGQLSPLVATLRDEALVLVDGFVRHAAVTRLKLADVLVEVVELDEIQMKAQMYLRNRERGLFLLEECRLVHELNRLDGLDQVDIGTLLERHKSWVCRRLGLYRSLSPYLRDDGALHRLGSGSIRRLAQLPHGNQDELFAIAVREDMGPRDVSTFVDLWARAPSPEARDYLRDHPRDALRLAAEGQRAAQVDPRVGPAGQLVLDRLLAMEQGSLRIVERLRRGVEHLPAEGAQPVAVALDRAQQTSVVAFEAVRQWVNR